ncbi:MAG: L-threonylcarbamoyladenylate synthase [Phycisphaeraceae bacterium]
MTAGQPPFAPLDDATIARAAAWLRAGELVAFPTETVYGLGANALDEHAVAKVFHVKGRPHFDPLIVHVSDADGARSLTTDWPEKATLLAEAFWPGSMTLVLPKRPVVPDLVTAGLPTVAVRVPDHPIALALIRMAGVPVAAPSANRFGGVSPTTADHVRDELGDRVAMVLDGGPCRTGVESTVVSLVDPDRPRVLRLGGLTLEAIEAVIGDVAVAGGAAKPQAAEAAVEAETKGQQSPGMLDRHYAPRTPMRVVAAVADFVSDRAGPSRRVGLLVYGRTVEQAKSEVRNAPAEVVVIETLSPTGDLVEAAANLFAAMRRLDGAGVDLIVAERVPDEGLGRAINDRLRRAGEPNFY